MRKALAAVDGALAAVVVHAALQAGAGQRHAAVHAGAVLAGLPIGAVGVGVARDRAVQAAVLLAEAHAVLGPGHLAAERRDVAHALGDRRRLVAPGAAVGLAARARLAASGDGDARAADVRVTHVVGARVAVVAVDGLAVDPEYSKLYEMEFGIKPIEDLKG